MVWLTEICRNVRTSEFMRSTFKPGAVIVSYGMRGGGKTHSAISFCQRMMEGYFPDMPEHIILVTNVIFVRRSRDGMDQESPKGVYMIHEMKELFPIVMDALEKYGRKDTMIILLLDEAQNFLLGDMNSKGDMASSMKVFCGIIRKFNLCLWLISPAMRNLGPAFRNFLDADNDPGNVNCTMQKNNEEAVRYMRKKGMERDPRSFVFVRPGFNARTEIMSVPTSSWTRDPESLPIGGYAYDHLSSADFTVGDFPFHDFVRYISGKSSFAMAKAIREFYDNMETEIPGMSDMKDAEHRMKTDIAKSLRRTGVKISVISKAFGVHENTVKTWTKGWDSDPSQEARESGD